MQKDPQVIDQPALAISSIQLAVNRCTDLRTLSTMSPPVYTCTGTAGNKAAEGENRRHSTSLFSPSVFPLCSFSEGAGCSFHIYRF